MKRIFYGWWIVLSTSIIHFWGAGTFFYSFTAFFNPIVEELGWSYTATSVAASIRSIEGGIASPLVGFAADRYGARRLLLAGSVLSGLGFVLFSRIQSLASFYAVFVFLSVGSSLLFPVPGWTAVANWFSRGVGTAMGILSAAIGLSGVVVFLANHLIEMFGWRPTLLVMGIGTWVVGIPCALVVRNRPEPGGPILHGEGPSQGTSHEKAEMPADPEVESFTLAQAFKTRVYWTITLIMTLASGAVHTVTVHIMPYLISVDFSRSRASMAASLLVILSACGRLGFGWLGNRMDKRYLLAIGLFLQALGLLMLTRAQGFAGLMLFSAIFGPGFGGVITLRIIIQAEYFGRKAFGAIQGVSMGLMVIGTMCGPLLAGMVYDLYGSYYFVWMAMAALMVAAIPLSLMIRKPELNRSSTMTQRHEEGI